MSYTVVYKKKSRVLPEAWNDLSKKEFFFCVDAIHALVESRKKLSDEDYVAFYYATRVKMVNKLIGFSFRETLVITAAQYADLLPVVDFLEKEIDINQNHLSYFGLGLRRYYGPEVGLRTSTFLEFITVDTYFVNYFKNHDVKLLYKLVACLYRPKQKGIRRKTKNGEWNGDFRQDFNAKLITARAAYFEKHLSLSKAHAILYFYHGFRNVHVLKFKNLFNQEEEVDVKRVGNNYGWAGTLLEISGDKFGNIAETGNSNWMDVFIELSRQMDKAKFST